MNAMFLSLGKPMQFPVGCFPQIWQKWNLCLQLLHDCKKTSIADELCYHMFCQNKQKKRNASTNNWLSTSTSEANYKAFLWSHALEAMQDRKSMECHGWMKNRELLVTQPITKALAQVNLLSDSEESCEKSTFEEELLNSWHMRHPYLRG